MNQPVAGEQKIVRALAKGSELPQEAMWHLLTSLLLALVSKALS
jgi:hypothetical protein